MNQYKQRTNNTVLNSQLNFKIHVHDRLLSRNLVARLKRNNEKKIFATNVKWETRRTRENKKVNNARVGFVRATMLM